MPSIAVSKMMDRDGVPLPRAAFELSSSFPRLYQTGNITHSYTSREVCSLRNSSTLHKIKIIIKINHTHTRRRKKLKWGEIQIQRYKYSMIQMDTKKEKEEKARTAHFFLSVSAQLVFANIQSASNLHLPSRVQPHPLGCSAGPPPGNSAV